MPGLATVASEPAFGLRCVRRFGDAVSDLAWFNDGDGLVVGDAEGMLHGLDADGLQRMSWRGHSAGVTRVCPQPGGGTRLATAGEDGRVMLWRGGDPVPEAILCDDSAWVEHLAWTPDGSVLAAAAQRTISLWRGSEPLGVWYDARRQVLGIAWAPDGRRLASAANRGLYLWRLGDGDAGAAEPLELLSFPGAPVAVAWQPAGRALAVGTQDGFLQIWRPASGDHKARQLTMRGYPGKVNCLAWHPRSLSLASAGGPDVVLWHLDRGGDGTRGLPLRHHRAAITTLAWSADGTLLAAGDRDGRLSLWDAQGELRFSHQLDDELAVLAWQPGCHRLAAGDTAGGLHLVEPLPATAKDANGD